MTSDSIKVRDATDKLIKPLQRALKSLRLPRDSAARQFFDSDGKTCTLDQLIRSEPGWARSRIISLEKQIDALEDQLELKNSNVPET